MNKYLKCEKKIDTRNVCKKEWRPYLCHASATQSFPAEDEFASHNQQHQQQDLRHIHGLSHSRGYSVP